MTLTQRIAALLGFSAYQPTSQPGARSLDDADVERQRVLFGGSIQPVAYSQTRWYKADLEAATHAADQGHLAAAARLWRAAQGDGMVRGVLSTRTGGLVRLPKKFRGRDELVADLARNADDGLTVFESMHPSSELAALVGDGVGIGVGVGEYLEVPGRDYPVFCRLDPEFLTYRWNENRWYYRSNVGELAITPGDGRWVLHTPGGRLAPWQYGLWRAVGDAWIDKTHAKLHKANWEGKLANPARVAVAPQGATEAQKQSWFAKVMAWGVNTVFGMTPGYDVKLLESNGRGYESFDGTVEKANAEIVVAIAGQTVTTDGGTGFANADVHKSIRADLIKETADGLAYTLNTQGLPAYVLARFGEDALRDGGVAVEWDVTPPRDRAAEATAAQITATAITQLTDALARHGLEPDVRAMCERAGVPVRAVQAAAANGAPKLELVRGAA